MSLTAHVKYAVALLNISSMLKYVQCSVQKSSPHPEDELGPHSSCWDLSELWVFRQDAKCACRYRCYKQEIIGVCKLLSKLPLTELLWSFLNTVIAFLLSSSQCMKELLTRISVLLTLTFLPFSSPNPTSSFSIFFIKFKNLSSHCLGYL